MRVPYGIYVYRLIGSTVVADKEAISNQAKSVAVARLDLALAAGAPVNLFPFQ